MAAKRSVGFIRRRGMALTHETQHCIWLMQWAELNQRRIPVLRHLFHIPNEGKRSPAAGAILKAMGLKPGVWDYFLPVPRHLNSTWYAGMWLEMKSPTKSLTKEQREFGASMSDIGYRTEVCFSWYQAAAAVMKYLEKEEGQALWPTIPKTVSP